MFNNYPSTLFENPKILKKIAPYRLVFKKEQEVFLKDNELF